MLLFLGKYLLLFADQIPAAAGPHLRRMHSTGWNIATVAGEVSLSRAVLRQHHFATQDDMRHFAGVCVVGIKRIGAVLPDVRSQEAFTVKLVFQ